MKIIVFSDSHGDTKTLDRIVKKHYGEIDVYLFLGDGLESIDFLIKKYPRSMFFAVAGNNDYGYDYPEDRLVVFKSKNIFMTHGHKYMGRDFRKIIGRMAKKQKIDVVLFGHVHIPSIGSNKEVLYLCPGSVSYPRGGSKKSYAILSIENDKVSGEIFRVEREIVK